MTKSHTIGSTDWPGLSKLVEEAGETLQIVGKIMQTGDTYFDGTNLRRRLEEELPDLMAAIHLVIAVNGLDLKRIKQREQEKYQQLREWHREQGGAIPGKTGKTGHRLREADVEHLFACPFPACGRCMVTRERIVKLLEHPPALDAAEAAFWEGCAAIIQPQRWPLLRTPDVKAALLRVIRMLAAKRIAPVK